MATRFDDEYEQWEEEWGEEYEEWTACEMYGHAFEGQSCIDCGEPRDCEPADYHYGTDKNNA